METGQNCGKPLDLDALGQHRSHLTERTLLFQTGTRDPEGSSERGRAVSGFKMGESSPCSQQARAASWWHGGGPAGCRVLPDTPEGLEGTALSQTIILEPQDLTEFSSLGFGLAWNPPPSFSSDSPPVAGECLPHACPALAFGKHVTIWFHRFTEREEFCFGVISSSLTHVWCR